MIELVVRKKALKDALAISKRTVPKNGKTMFVGNGNELLVRSVGENVQVFDYIPLIKTAQAFAIEVDPTLVDKWLDKADRDMVFQIKDDKLHCIEKNDVVDITKMGDAVSLFYDARMPNYKPFENEDLVLKSFEEANKTFYPYERRYADYAKITDNNLFIYNPLITSIFFYQENFGILGKFGTDGIAIHKNAIDVLVKSIKKPKAFSHALTEKSLLIREQDTVFIFPYITDISFPDIRTELEPLAEEKYEIVLNSENVQDVLATIPTKTNKVMFDANEDFKLVISSDNPDFNSITLDIPYYAPRCAFSYSVVQAFFEGLSGELKINYSRFNSRTSKGAFLWKFQDKEKTKIMPGIKEAPGFKQKTGTVI